MTRISTDRLRKELDGTLERVAKCGRRFIVRRGKEDVAVILPIADVQLLERLAEEAEDRADVEEASRILREIRAGRHKTWSLDQVRRRFGL